MGFCASWGTCCGSGICLFFLRGRGTERYDGLLRLLGDLLRLRDLPLLPPRSRDRDLLRPLPPLLPPLLISTLTLLPHTLVPSRPRTASRGSSISTKAKPGGLLATQTLRTGPYLANESSKSYLLASSRRPPM